ncbi:ATP-binding protein [Thermodesulfobacteriota bacterium]
MIRSNEANSAHTSLSKMGLKRKLILSTSGIILILGLIITFFIQVSLTKTLTHILENNGVTIARNLAVSSESYLLTDDIVELQRFINDVKNAEDDVYYIYILDKKGYTVVHTFEKGVPASFASIRPTSMVGECAITLILSELGHIRDVAVPLGTLGKAHVGISEKHIRDEIAHSTFILLLMTLAFVVIGTTISYIIVSWEIKPLDHLTKGAAEIRSGNLDYRIEVHTKDEIGTLAKEFNKMASDLAESRSKLVDSNEELESTNEELNALNDLLEKRVEARTLEKEDLWHQLLQSQKLESIGRLTGGIAHDFNNILTSTIGYSSLILEMLDEDSRMKDMVERIYKSGKKASDLINQLLAFSRKQMLEMKVKNLNDILEDTLDMFSRIIGEHIYLNMDLDPKAKNIMADETQIEQLIMNLVVNARDAMPDGGNLDISVKNIVLDRNFARSHHGIHIGEYVMLSVKDSGVGMGKEVQENIFEPFFTTKEKGKGTGLGLSTIFGIVKQHNGHIFFDSAPGEGTEFKIYLPASDGEVEEEDVEEYIKEKGNETILIVEDNPIIRNLFIDIIEPLGHKVLIAPDGEEALKICESYDEKIDLLLSDVIMPGINGLELSKQVKRKLPDIKIILTSGYLENTAIFSKIREAKIPFIKKPLNASELIKIIRKTLDGRA